MFKGLLSGGTCRGTEAIEAVCFAREKGIPFWDFAWFALFRNRVQENVAKVQLYEYPHTPFPVIDLLPGQRDSAGLAL